MKLKAVREFTEIPVRNRVGGGGRPRSEFMQDIAKLQPRQSAEYEFESNETYEDSAEGFKKWVAKVSAQVSTASTNGTLPFICQTISNPSDRTITIYRLDGELADAAIARREKVRATLAAKKAKATL